LNNQDNIDNKLLFPGIDYDIGVGNVLGDDELFKEILLMFYEDHKTDGESIQQAILDKDQTTCKRLVHTLKGVACSIGAMALFERTKLLDMAINEKNEGDYQPLFDNVKPEFDTVISGIESILGDTLP